MIVVSNLAIQLLSYVTEKLTMGIFPDLRKGNPIKGRSSYLHAFYAGLRQIHLVLLPV
jgi:hypothetical protein